MPIKYYGLKGPKDNSGLSKLGPRLPSELIWDPRRLYDLRKQLLEYKEVGKTIPQPRFEDKPPTEPTEEELEVMKEGVVPPRSAFGIEYPTEEEISVTEPTAPTPPVWEAIRSTDTYQAMTEEERMLEKNRYFDEIVSPNISEKHREKVRKEFISFANKQDEPQFIRDTVLGTMSRLGGVLVGTLNAPSAYIWGAATEKAEKLNELENIAMTAPDAEVRYMANQDIEKVKNRTGIQETIDEMKSGFKSSWESISHKGAWGKNFHTFLIEKYGKSLDEMLPEEMQGDGLGEIGEFIVEMLTDPLVLVGAGEAKALLKVKKLKVPTKQEMLKKIVPGRIAEKFKPGTKLSKKEAKAVEGEISEAEERLAKRDTMVGEHLKRILPEEVLNKIDEIDNLRADRKAILIKRIEKAYEDAEEYKRYVEENTLPEGLVSQDRFRRGIETPERRISDMEKELAGIELREKGIREARTNVEKSVETAVRERDIPITTRETAVVAGATTAEAEAQPTRVGATSAAKKIVPRAAPAEFAGSEALIKVHGMVGETEPEVRGIMGFINNATKKGNQAFIDRFAPIKKVSEEAYEEAIRSASAKEVAGLKFNELVEAFKPVRGESTIMENYITAHRAMERASRGLANPNGVDYNTAVQAIKDAEKLWASKGKDVGVLRKALKDWVDWTDKYILKEALDNGFLSKAAYDDIKKNNKYYAAYHVINKLPEDLHNPILRSKEYFSAGNQNIIKAMTGTEELIKNPVEATIQKFSQAQDLIARNKVASILVDDPRMKDVVRPIATTQKEFAIMQNRGMRPVMEGSWDTKEFDIINRFKDGAVEQYLVNKDIASAMKQASHKSAPRIINALNNVFRASATTMYLPFTISNMVRDALMAYITAPVHGAPHKFIKDWGKGMIEGFKHSFGTSDLTQAYLKSGGGFGFSAEVKNARLAAKKLFNSEGKRVATEIVNPLKFVEKVTNAIELASRVGTYDRAIKLGYQPKKAALIARKATIDFNRSGTLMKVANQFIPFINARLQSKVVLAEALKRSPKETLTKAFTSVVIPGMSAYMWNRIYFSDLYDDIPREDKEKYFCIITGTDKDKKGNTIPTYLTIPKGDFGELIWNPNEYAFDRWLKKDREGFMEFGINYLSGISPVEFAKDGEISPTRLAGGLIPPPAKAVLEPVTGLSFYKAGPVVPGYLKEKPAELQYTDFTPDMYKWLGKKLKVSPIILQTIAGNIVTGYGREGLDPSAMLRGMTGRLYRSRGGEMHQKAAAEIYDLDRGYKTVRYNALELLKEGKRAAAGKLLDEWNRGLNKRVAAYNKRFKGTKYVDKGGLRRSYLFTPKKKKNIFIQKPHRGFVERKTSPR